MQKKIDFEIETGEAFNVRAVSQEGKEFIELYSDIYEKQGFVVGHDNMVLEHANRWTVPNFVYELCDHDLAASFSF